MIYRLIDRLFVLFLLLINDDQVITYLHLSTMFISTPLWSIYNILQYLKYTFLYSGKKERLQLRFTPRLSDDEIRKEAVRMITKQMEFEAAEEYKRQMLYEAQQKEEAAVSDDY